jgi:hypothetical protein
MNFILRLLGLETVDRILSLLIKIEARLAERAEAVHSAANKLEAAAKAARAEGDRADKVSARLRNLLGD